MNYSSVIITIETITINEFWLPNHIGVCLKRRVLILLPALSVNKGHVLPSAPLIFFSFVLGVAVSLLMEYVMMARPGSDRSNGEILSYKCLRRRHGCDRW